MARTVEVTLGRVTYHMPATFQASQEIALSVGDPLMLALAAGGNGIIKLSIDQIVTTLEIGTRLSGHSLTKEKIGEMVIEQGVAEYLVVVGMYLGQIIGGGPEKSGNKSPSKKA